MNIRLLLARSPTNLAAATLRQQFPRVALPQHPLPSIITMSQQAPPSQRRGFSARGGGHRGRGPRRGRGGGSVSNGNGIQHREISNAAPASEDQEMSSPSTPRDDSHLSDVTFASLKGTVDDRVLANIAFDRMTAVQAATLAPALSGKDVLAQAKTGTGKTVAFLLPAIQRLLASKREPGLVSVLILTPTRELALQIEKEANILLRGFENEIGVQHTVGGTNMTTETKNLKSRRCDILVATPGRLVDHLENNGLAPRFSKLQTFVLDEADRMLDMGFAPDLQKIKRALPKPNQVPRQSLLFSATYTPSIIASADIAPDHVFVNTIPEHEQNTHEHVAQTYETGSMSDVLPLTLKHLLNEMQANPTSYKIICFLPTAKATALAKEVMSLIPQAHPQNHYEIHSRMSQSARVKASDNFRKSATAVLFSSDVSARGVDFPGVTLVLQSGLPSDSDQYIHRLGRTARAGADGRGVLLLGEEESFFLRDKAIAPLPLKREPPTDISAFTDLVNNAMDRISLEKKGGAYAATLGFYKSFARRMGLDSPGLVRVINTWAREGLRYVDENGGTVPPLEAKTVGKMGLKGTPGLNIVKSIPSRSDSPAMRGRGGGRGGGGGGGGGRGGHGRR